MAIVAGADLRMVPTYYVSVVNILSITISCSRRGGGGVGCNIMTLVVRLLLRADGSVTDGFSFSSLTTGNVLIKNTTKFVPKFVAIE